MANSRQPDRIAYQVIKTGDDKPDFWQRIGAGWVNKDDSISVELNAIPKDFRLVLQLPKADEDQPQG